MNIGNIFFPQSAALRPGLACEIAPAGVVAARTNKDGQEFHSAFAPLPPSVFFTGLKAPGFSDRPAVASALRQALDEVSQRETKVTVVVPDASVRVLLLDFDSLPSKNDDVVPIIRFRLRKLVPFEVEDAPVSYQTMPGKDGVIRTICAVSPAAVLKEYESAVRDAGYEPGVVLPSTLAALAAVPDGEPSLVVNRNGNSVTTAIAQGNELLLHRTLELAEPEFSHREDPEGEWTSDRDQPRAIEELRQSVSVAVAYFEDTLLTPPLQLLVSGAGGAEELQHLLGDNTIPVRDLAPASTIGNMTAMPAGLLAGVRGALSH